MGAFRVPGGRSTPIEPGGFGLYWPPGVTATLITASLKHFKRGQVQRVRGPSSPKPQGWQSRQAEAGLLSVPSGFGAELLLLMTRPKPLTALPLFLGTVHSTSWLIFSIINPPQARELVGNKVSGALYLPPSPSLSASLL